MVYMSSSGLDWKPVLQAWLKTRTNREKMVFMDLFEQSFLNIYTFGTQNFEFMMEVLQCNIIQQMLCILDGLVPFSKDVEDKTTMSLAGSNEGIENGGSGGGGGVTYRCRFHVHLCSKITIGLYTFQNH